MENNLRAKLEKLDKIYLFDVVRNYKKYNYPESSREIALEILKGRDISTEELEEEMARYNLKESGKESLVERLEGYYSRFKKNSITILILYLVAVVIIPLAALFIVDRTASMILVIVRLILTAVYLAAYIIVYLNYYNFNKEYYEAKNRPAPIILYFIFGFPLFFIAFPLLLSDMKKKLAEKRG